MDDIRIVILQRGWVMVGKYQRFGTHCTLTGGFSLRRWGTTKGLGEIADGGPTKNTVMDPLPLVEFHELTEIASIRCNGGAWASFIRNDM